MGHHRHASETPYKLPNIECWLGSFVIFQGIWTSIAKKTYNFVIFQGGSGPPALPLDPHMNSTVKKNCEPSVITRFVINGLHLYIGSSNSDIFNIWRVDANGYPLKTQMEFCINSLC